MRLLYNCYFTVCIPSYVWGMLLQYTVSLAFFLMSKFFLLTWISSCSFLSPYLMSSALLSFPDDLLFFDVLICPHTSSLLGASIFPLGPWYITSSLIIISFLLLRVSWKWCFHLFIISRCFLIKLLSLFFKWTFLVRNQPSFHSYCIELSCLISFVCILSTFQHFKCLSYFLPSTDFLGFPSLIFLILNIQSCLPIPHFNWSFYFFLPPLFDTLCPANHSSSFSPYIQPFD